MIGADTPFPYTFLIPAGLLILAVLAGTYYRLRHVLRPSHLAGLAGLRALALVALLLLLFNPYSNRQEPDPEGFRVAVLADASGSMETRDVRDGQFSRRELVEEWLQNPDTRPMRTLTGNGYRIDRYRFSEHLAPLRGDRLEILPGRTGLGDVLNETLERTEAQRDNLGGVLLLSDGHHNTGTSAQEAARRYRSRGIPVTTIGVGSREPPGEVRGDFAVSRVHTERAEPVELPVELSNTHDSDRIVRLRLSDEAGTVDEREIVIPAGTEEHRERFTVTPVRRGDHLYRLSIQDLDTGGNGDEQMRYAFVSAEEPETFAVLYLGGRLNPEYRFIERGIVDSDQIGLESLIRTGPESFFQALSEDNEADAPSGAFPQERSFLNRFDALLVDTRVLADMSDDGIEALADFVSVRGGGILFFGPLEEIPEKIAGALPVLKTEERVPRERLRLEIEPAPIFGHLEGGRLFGSPALFFGDNMPVVVTREWKTGARPVLRREGHENEVIMAAQAFGAGRVAYTGTESTWQWRMASSGGLEQHRLFWENLLVWLSSAGKPRLTVSSQGEQYALGESVNLQADVLGSDFRPARDASVSVRVTYPSGETWDRRLQPAFDVGGRYRTSFSADQPGEYRARYRIDFADGARMERDVYFLATHAGTEGEDTRYRESLLRDLARITGGDFHHYSELSDFDNLALSDEVPVRDSRVYWADHGLFLTLFMAALAAEWYFRRRLGLK